MTEQVWYDPVRDTLYIVEPYLTFEKWLGGYIEMYLIYHQFEWKGSVMIPKYWEYIGEL